MNTKHIIVNGDSRKMADLDDQSINLIITSPPYWQLKDYGTDEQIGYNDSYENYINNLNLVWKECFRVLHKGSRLCINIGDQFARAVYYGRYKIIPIRTEIIKFCEIIGFDYMGAIIWQKVTTSNTTGGATIMGSYPYPRNGILKLDYEFILIFKKPGEGPKVTRNQKEQSILSKEEWNEYFQGHWNFSGERQSNHIAMFPLELPKRLIKMFSFVGETVLDPFLGSGTTSLAAKTLQRNSVGYEINNEFLPIIEEKLNPQNNKLFSEDRVDFIKSSVTTINFNKEFAELPYKFVDFHKLDKKIDPKSMSFGSKIDKDSKPREEFYTVKEIINSEILKLDNDIKIRLIGICEKPNNEKALFFLNESIKGRKVFLKYDTSKYDKENNLLCYLYLQNKTFINAHLIKKGLANVDEINEYNLKVKFLKLKGECDE